jgi:putative transposase
MPDRVHFVVAPSGRNQVADVVRFIKGAFAREHTLRNGTAGSVWQPSFDRRLIRSSARLAAIIDYIDGNPVKAGFVDDIAAYAFGSGCGRYPTNLEAYVGDRRPG